MSAAGRRPRVSIERRREQILAAALKEFSHKGLHGGSTVTIAKDVEISHPNLFRVFSTKKELFMAVLRQCFDTIARTMLAAGEAAESDHLQVMSDAWGVLMENRELMLILTQGYAACNDPDIRDLMQEWTQDMFERMEALPGVGTDKAHDFFAAGMLYLVAASMNLPERAPQDPWAQRFLDSGS
ncbi:TetR/AcrR family transcriptional regulator [Actinoalloteichus hymeniacidonis]|uniref:Transcriptional regulator, TetR family n=1 Tax=Actinoalloteichus hymeniacidonis TaxID=340345 RepID=A0AAC9HT57_9PSEU|nr:TetR/AcrR family transcriptional regulator [Actinoalloteichus hymeniacidonis]AOS64010.1 transcriptional regulator, TetR family [Actinoalloteichus hymeniacidonis]MBB5907928.1 AcrR family transcriptional regulator [Actinoalloteichus hymeniacidonis]